MKNVLTNIINGDIVIVDEDNNCKYPIDLINQKKIELLKNQLQLDEKSIKNKIGRKYKSIIINMLPLMIKLSYKIKDNFQVFPISQNKYTRYTVRELNKYCNGLKKENIFCKNEIMSQQVISKYLQILINIGVIIVIDDRYTFESPKTKNLYPNCYNFKNHSKMYIGDKQYLINFINFVFDLLNVKKVDPEDNEESTILNTEIDTTILNSNDENKNIYEKLSIYCKNEINNNLNHYNDLIDESNDNIINNDIFIQYYQPMKGRLYAPICNLKNDKNSIEETRDNYLNRYYGLNNWYEFDRKASIYNLAYTMITSKYNNNDYDFYTELYGKSFNSGTQRKGFKLLCMFVMFSDLRGINNKYHSIINTAINKGKISKKNYDFIVAMLNCINWNNESVDETYSEIKKIYYETKDNFNRIFGKELKEIKKYIFIFESYVYIDFVSTLRKKGIKVIHVYDGFYVSKQVRKCFVEDLLKNKIMEFSNFVNNLKVN